MDAVGTVAAYVASADGKIDSIEQETLGQFYYKLKAVQAVGFELGDVNMLFADLAEQFQLKGKRDDETALGALRPVRGRVLLAEALVYLGLAIGHADHFFADKERIAITWIIGNYSTRSEYWLAVDGGLDCLEGGEALAATGVEG